MKIRALSAIVAIVILLGIGYFGGIAGLTALSFLIVILLSLEASTLLFFDSPSRTIRRLFLLCNLTIFSLFIFLPEYSEMGLALTAMIFCSTSLFVKRKFESLADLSIFQARSLMGFFYVGLLPAFATRLLYLNDGIHWFVFLLAVVFAGDTFAYLFGRWLGSKKLMSMISPKKTLEGAAGGLLGSSIVGALFGLFVFDQYALVPVIILALISGFFAQLGDLFESLLKRVANTKDSGNIMPGHGGMLDRIDGLLFSAPVVLAGAMILTRMGS